MTFRSKRWAGKAKVRKPPKKAMTRVEREYLAMLSIDENVAKVLDHESIKLRLSSAVPGMKGSYYSPDFPVIASDGVVEFHEVKGPKVWEDAWLKFKQAVDRYPEFRWVYAQKKSRREGWEIRRL